MNKKQNKKIFMNKKAGFTVIESLVAIFILMISITGPMVFTQSSLRAAFVSRDQITAFYLAQDAIEYIKNVRDNNSLDILDGDVLSDGWLHGLDKCFVANTDESGCTIDTDTPVASAIKECSISAPGCLGTNPENDMPLKIKLTGDNNDTVFLGTEGTDGDSIFSREIKIVPVGNNGDEVEINVFVRWNTNETIGSRRIVVKENMFNWAGFDN